MKHECSHSLWFIRLDTEDWPYPESKILESICVHVCMYAIYFFHKKVLGQRLDSSPYSKAMDISREN